MPPEFVNLLEYAEEMQKFILEADKIIRPNARHTFYSSADIWIQTLLFLEEMLKELHITHLNDDVKLIYSATMFIPPPKFDKEKRREKMIQALDNIKEFIDNILKEL
jgi:hypothetical protein